MLVFFLMLLLAAWFANKVFAVLWRLYNKIKTDNLLEHINSREELLYLHFKDFLQVIIEVLKRKGYKVRITDKCGEEGNGLILNGRQYVEVWKHSINQIVDVEAAMKLARCMQVNSTHRGMLITLGDFKQNTRVYCHKNVIECINGEQLLEMCKEVQTRKGVLETG
jgi:restriction system protein